jgi:hypothetical protein
MKAVRVSHFRERLDDFVRWFCNVSPSAPVDAGRPAERAAAGRRKPRLKQRRRLQHAVPTTRAIRER